MQRLMALRRLGAVYELIEEIHSIEARMAAADVGEAETAIRAETNTLHLAWREEREAMQGQDSLGRSAMAAREEVAIRKTRQLEPILTKRREIGEAAKARHMASRLWSERMKSLIDGEAGKIAALEQRRLQAASDDRFLAQRRGKKRRADLLREKPEER